MSSSPIVSWKPWRPIANGRYLPEMEIPEQGTSLEGIERELIEIALKQAGGNQTQAARLLGISRDTLRYRIKKFDLVRSLKHKNGSEEESSDESVNEPGFGLNG